MSTEPLQPCAACRLPKCTRSSWMCERRYGPYHYPHDPNWNDPAARARAPDIHASRRYCEECRAAHVGRSCARCDRVGCWHEVPDCRECGRPVCFESAHSVRVAGRTCCLECCAERADTRGRVVALTRHLPPGVVAHVGWVLERGAGGAGWEGADGAHNAAASLAVRQRTWPACRMCGVRRPDMRPRHTRCLGGCTRERRLPGPTCDACFSSHKWRCRKCTNNGR